MRARDFLVVLVVIAALAAFQSRKPAGPTLPTPAAATPVILGTPYVHPCPYAINGIRLDMTPDQVKASLGEPTSTSDRRWNYETAQIDVTMSFLHERIWSVQASKGAVFTKNGGPLPIVGQSREKVEASLSKPHSRAKTYTQYRSNQSVITIHFKDGKAVSVGLFDDR
jgi:hypothetical protein